MLNLAPNEYGKPLVFTPDFVIAYPDGTWRVVDAKPKGGKNSPEWLRGKKAFEGLYGIVVEETDK